MSLKIISGIVWKKNKPIIEFSNSPLMMEDYSGESLKKFHQEIGVHIYFFHGKWEKGWCGLVNYISFLVGKVRK